MLRMFNDGLAMCLLYAALLLFSYNKVDFPPSLPPPSLPPSLSSYFLTIEGRLASVPSPPSPSSLPPSLPP
jgi:hypothetical protein